MLKSILDGYRLRRPVRDDLVIVDTAGKLVQALTVAAEVMFEYGQVESSQIPHRLCSKFRQLLSRNFADARQASNRQWQQKRIYVLRLDDKEPIRLAPVRGEFCQELVWRYARRGRQIQFLDGFAHGSCAPPGWLSVSRSCSR